MRDFVANDVRLDGEDVRFLILTGPNMAGKSTLLRQVALIALLAQMGAFVPARRARIGIADRIFTRVGASDSLATGESTFMVEMRETAAILREGTRRSLVLLDEIGRGTSHFRWTFDRLGGGRTPARLPRGCARESCSRPTTTSWRTWLRTKAGVRNFHFTVAEREGEILFLRKHGAGRRKPQLRHRCGAYAGLPPK